MLLLILTVILLACLTSCVLTFNVDTNNPIVFKGPKNSYFGFSVAILENSKGTWLLVGAPRTNDSFLPNVHEPGAVFHCNWRNGSSCKPVFIDNIGNERQVFVKWKNVTVKNNKNNQWLGASLDVNIQGDSQVMICAPRWADHKFDVQGMQLMNGLCYESNRDLQFNRSSAWPVLEDWNKQVHTLGYYSYGMGSLGTAAAYSRKRRSQKAQTILLALLFLLTLLSLRFLHLLAQCIAGESVDFLPTQVSFPTTEDVMYGKHLLGEDLDGKFSVLGAPGLNDWSGGFAYIEESTSKPRIMELSADTDNDSYFGMSVTTAKLSMDDVAVVMGGPRAGGNGKVYAYNSKFQLIVAKEGDQLGSSFGASVCAVDLNGDGLDDLAVGAPFYSEARDEGRVYIYINKEFFSLELVQPLLVGSNAPGARFGSAIANIGDINKDSFEDIAVGAPYEEEAGVVFIYNGAKYGLHQGFSQRILGKNIGNNLKTFGWSFSRPSDVDGNHYKDFAVGAFESDSAVLLLTRPVFDLHASLKLNPMLIDMSIEPKCAYNGESWHCLEVILCLQYSGQNLAASTEVNVTLRLDTLERHLGERARMFIISEAHTETETINELVTARLNQETCSRNYTVYVRKCRDILTPLKVELDYDITSESVDISSKYNISHIRNKYNAASISDLAVIALHCGDDHVCIPQFYVKATPLFNDGNKCIVIDDTSYFEVKIDVFNSGEVSYLTVVTIDYPSSVQFATASLAQETTNIICTPVQDIPNTTLATLTCHLMTPVKSRDNMVLIAKFYTYYIEYNVHKVYMRIKVSSIGHGNGTSIGEITSYLTIPVQMRSEIKLSGVSLPGHLIMPQELLLSDNDTEWSGVSHLYTLRNQGPSAMPYSNITLSLPTEAWLKLINVQTITKMADDTVSHVPVQCIMPADPSEGRQSQAYISRSNSHLGSSSTYSLNCNSAVCSNVTCYIGHFHKYETVFINVSLAVRTNVLHMLKVDNHLRLMSVGILKLPNYMSFYSLTPCLNVTTTTYIKHKGLPRQIITWWMLTISVASGLLLVYILAVILWKCGFFRRKYREELQLLINSSEPEQELLHSDTHSASSSDIMDIPPGHSLITANHDHYDQHEPEPLSFPELQENYLLLDQHFERPKPIKNHSQTRRDMNINFPQLASFHSFQHRNHHINNERDHRWF